jgi:hypothetical protein
LFYAKPILTVVFVHDIIPSYQGDKDIGASMENTL